MMLKRISFGMGVVLLMALLAGCGASGYKVEQQAGGYSVVFSMPSKPAVGDAQATVQIKDDQGVEVTNAQVQVDYSMPAMPGMPAMNYKADATLAGKAYQAVLNFSMSGSWNIAVVFSVNGQKQKITFSVDAQ